MSKTWVLISDATCVRTTDKAGLFKLPDQGEEWIPWSQIRDGSPDKDGEKGDLWISQWIADEKGLDGDDEEEGDWD